MLKQHGETCVAALDEVPNHSQAICCLFRRAPSKQNSKLPACGRGWITYQSNPMVFPTITCCIPKWGVLRVMVQGGGRSVGLGEMGGNFSFTSRYASDRQ